MAVKAAVKKPKLRKADRLIKVLDPKGQAHELSHRNAYDLINHKGWKLPQTEEDVVEEKAKAPRREKKKGGGLPKGVVKPGDRKVRRVPSSRNSGPGPHMEDENLKRLDAESAAQVYDDDDIEDEKDAADDEGNGEGGASLVENVDD